MRDWVRVWAVLAVSALLEDLTVAEALNVSITVNYTSPPGSDLGTDEYRAASGPVTVTCNSGGDENVTYLWSSTCRNCVFDNNTKQEIFRAAVHSGDNGIHTCTVTMESNETVVGSASINFNIVGAGIHVFRGDSTGDVGSLSNNGVIISSNTDLLYHFRFFCRSDSMEEDVGTLIGLDGTYVTTGDAFNITNPQPGELLVESRSMNQSNFTASDQGVYTCRIPLQSEDIKNINIGIYLSGFRVPPRITSVTREAMSSNVSCISTGSPATNVTWMRNGQPLTIGGSLYLLTQIVVDRSQSTYENVLTVLDSDIDRCSYTCTVTNALGYDSQTYSTPPSATPPSATPPRATISPPGRPTAGEAFSLTCTVTVTVGDPPSVQWTRPNGSIIQETTTDDCTTTYISTLELSPVRTSHGGLYKCSTGGNSSDTKTLIVQIPPPKLAMSRDPDATVILHNGDPLTLTCTIQLDPAVVDSNVVVTGNLGGPGGNSTTMPVMDSVGVYRITLHISSLWATLSATYTCNATVMPGPGVVNVVSSKESNSSLDITVELNVNITVSYIPLPGAELGPNQYRAASGPVTVTCTAVDGTGPVSYQWSSTCRDCPFQTENTSSVRRAAVHSGDTGNHTCTATRDSISGSETIIFNVVGAGIHVFRGAATGDLQVPGSLPNNGIVISRNIAEDGVYFRFFCRSESMMSNVGMLIGPDGTTVATGDVFTVSQPQPGELQVENRLSQNNLTARDQGVYTCRIPLKLQSGDMRDINIGIYPNGSITLPSITHLGFTRGDMLSTLTCISTGSPATNVTWMREGQLLTLNGSTYQLTQTVTNRSLSTYENVLTIPDMDGCYYTCTVTNALGKDSQIYPPLRTTVSPPGGPTAGQNFSLTCTVTVAVGDSLSGSVQWTGPDSAMISSSTRQSLSMTDNCTVTYTSTLELSPLRTSHGGQYVCQATSNLGKAMATEKLIVKIPPPTLTVSRDPDANTTLRHGDNLTLTCTIQLDKAVDSDVMVTGRLQRRAGGENAIVKTSDKVYKIMLYVPSLLATPSDTYTCTATVEPGSGVMNVLCSESHSNSLNITVELDVSINVSYVPPPGTELKPNEYRVASGPVTVTCTAVGGTGLVSYQWSSTCRSCPFQSATSSSITRAAVHSGDTGTHTCTATSGSTIGNASINFNVIGAGIHLFRGASTGNLQVPRPLPNNGIVVSLNTTSDIRFRFVCRSDSMVENAETLVGPDGTIVTTGSVFDISHPQPGELRVENGPPQNLLTASDQGVYTCRTPLEGEETRDIHVGIYPSGFNTPPNITSVTRRSMSSHVTCISTGSPATNVTWMRNGQPLPIDGSLYQLTQTVTNRSLSTYENVLTIPDVNRCSYTCTVTNALGDDSKTFFPPPRTTISPPGTLTAGEPFSLICTVILTVGDSLSVQWTGPDGVVISSSIQETTTDDCTITYISTLELSPVKTYHDGLHTCQVTSTAGRVMANETLIVQTPLPGVTISPPGTPTAGEPFSLTCTVILVVGDSLLDVQWTSPDNATNSGSIQETTTDNCTMTYTSTLELSSVRTSHGGQYTCNATSTVGPSLDTKTLIVQIPPSTLTVSRDPDATVILRHGDNLTLTCSIQLDPAVDSDVVVTGRLQGRAGGNSTIVTTSDGVYKIMLHIPSLRATPSDTYTCTATVEPGSGVMNVQRSESRSDSLNITVALQVSINVSYIPPSGTELEPNEYRAASGPVTVTCTAMGGTGSVSYEWSSTCRDCPFQRASNNSVTRAAVHSGDTGTHTCRATCGSITGSANINFNVIGAGIHLFRGASIANLQVPRLLQNNGIIVSLNTTSDLRFRFVCRSDSMVESTGTLVGPDGTIVITGSVFNITHPLPGEVRVENGPPQNVPTASDQGVYTCRIPLQSGEMRDINVGIYPSGFSTPPNITHLGFTHGSMSSNLTCISTGSPATTVTWMKNGQPLSLDGSTYKPTQTVANRTLSTYKNVLIINRVTANIIGNTYNCTVINAFGTDLRTLKAYLPPTVTISPPEIPIAGESFSLTCTVTLVEGDSLIGDPAVQWMGPDGVSINDTQQIITNDSTVTYISTLEFTQVQTSHGGQYTCQATSTAGTITNATLLTVQRSSGSSIPAGVVGGAIAGVLIVVLIVIIIVAALWLKQHRKLHLQPQPKRSITGDSLELTVTGQEQGEKMSSSVQTKSEGISVAWFSAHVSNMHAHKDRGFQSEFESLRKEPLASYDAAITPCNIQRNRFRNIYPYDFCRVKLKEIEGVQGSDYINASFIVGYTKQNEYIASQAPVPGAVGDFWRMIWEHKVTTIAMLTRCNEGGKKKCEQYWPKTVNGTEEVGYNLTVTLTSILPFAEYEIRTLIVKDASNHMEPALEVTHFFYQAWPDHGVPLNAISLISFIQVVRKSHPPSHPQPLLVHCSAGVGRTGTFIVIDMEMQRIKDMGVVNVFGCLEKLRRQRVQLVQTLAQYVFIHNALDELITCGKTDISAVNLRIITNQLHKTASGKQVSGFQDQFELLQQVSPNLETASFSDATATCNLSKNRYTSKVAGNYCRVFLRQAGVDGSDYINANFVDGYRKRGAYIATQGPLASTVNDFWKMIWDYQSKCIVMLCSFMEEGEESCYPYWPTNQGLTTKYHGIGVTLKSEEKYHAYIVRKFEVFEGKSKSTAENRGPSPFTVTQFQLLFWPKHGRPSPPVLLEVMENINRVQRITGNKAITVMCNDGMGRTGAFICLHAQIEKLKTEGVIDCFQFIKSARLNRPGLVQSVEQYILCHEVVKEFVGSFETYSNFQEVV